MEWKRRLTMIGIAVGVYAGYAYLLPVAIPFLAAWLLAAWLHPVAVKIHRRTKLKTGWIAAVLLSLLFGAAGCLLFVGLRELLSQIAGILRNLPFWMEKGGRLLERLLVFLEDSLGIASGDSQRYLDSLAASATERLLSLEPAVWGRLSQWLKTTVLFLSGIGVAFISAILLLGDMEHLRKNIWDYSWLVGVRRVVQRLKKTTVAYGKAQAVIMLLVAVVCSVGFWLMKSPYFLIQGIVLGGLDALPLLGTGSFLYPAALYYLLNGRAKMALGCVALDLATSFLRELLEPRLLGGNLGVPPIAVLASVYIGVFLYGGWGVILGPLSFSTAYEIGREWDVWG